MKDYSIMKTNELLNDLQNIMQVSRKLPSGYEH